MTTTPEERLQLLEELRCLVTYFGDRLNVIELQTSILTRQVQVLDEQTRRFRADVRASLQSSLQLIADGDQLNKINGWRQHARQP